MHVFLVLPPFNPLSVAGRRGRTVEKGHLPPLGAGYLAAVLRARGHEVSFIDGMAAGMGVGEMAERVCAASPEVVGISCLSTRSAPAAYTLAGEIRRTGSRAHLVMGGPHVNSYGGLVLRQCPDLDFAMMGEAEHAFADLVDALREGRPPAGIPGLVWRDGNGEPVEPGGPAVAENLDELPFPDRTIYDTRMYYPLLHQNLDCSRPATSVIASRGCSWSKCRFCFRGDPAQQRLRRRSPENVVAEIVEIRERTGVRQVKFVDDNFCLGERWVSRFCELLRRDAPGTAWTVLSRVDSVTETMLARMAEAGCRSVQYGIESGNQELLDLVRKGITLEQSRQAVRMARRAGLSVFGICILGLPTETPEMSLRTINFACELNADYMLFMPYYPFHGTELAEFALTVGTFFPDESDDFHLPVYVPDTYASRQQMGEMVALAYRKYYFRPRYISLALRRCLTRPSQWIQYLQATMSFAALARKRLKDKARPRTEA